MLLLQCRLLIATATTLFAVAIANASPPLVSGYDRYGKHDELSPRVSGQLLISSLNCTACHQAKLSRLNPVGAPNLAGAGVRLRKEWLRSFLMHPQNEKPTTTMPDILAGVAESERDDVVESLVAFLMSQQQPFQKLKGSGRRPVPRLFWDRGDADSGRHLYHTIGCVACHEPDEDYETVETKPSPIDQLIEQLDVDELADMGLASEARAVQSVAHSQLDKKYTRRSLTMFLLDPPAVRPSGRMPSLKLLPTEAADIASYLIPDSDRRSDDNVGSTAPSDRVQRGRELFVQLKCANCHSIPGLKPKMATPMTALDFDKPTSCFGQPKSGMPKYALDAGQIAAIKEPAARALTPTEPWENVHFRMLQLNCYGCHARELPTTRSVSFGGVGRFRKRFFETVTQVDLGDEGRLPPSLTGVGRKLTVSALNAALQPTADAYRKHMTARMPGYPKSVTGPLVNSLPSADHAKTESEQAVFGEMAGLAESGRALVNTGCVQCHPFRGENLPGVVGLDLDQVTKRVHPSWFAAFLRDPGSVKKRTRMPTFFPDGKSTLPDLLEGDVDRQIASVWAYLKELPTQPLPEKIAEARSKNYELIPSERPIVLRTFMEGVGMHAIAVGSPSGVHYAFDAESMRLAVAWKGRFLDAQSTWFERFATPTNPLDASVQLSPSFSLAALEGDLASWPDDANRAGYRFGGLRMDGSGVPTLLYQIGNWQVADRVVATDSGLDRSLTITRKATNDDAKPLTLLAHTGDKITRAGPWSFVDTQGLTVKVSEDVGHAGELVATERGQHWWIPLDIKDRKTIQLEYRW